MDKNLQKTYLSFFHIMLQFFSRDPGDENQLDSGLWKELKLSKKIKYAELKQKMGN